MHILKVENLSVSFFSQNKRKAVVKDLSFELNRGECLCIVGESGSGKSVTARAILGILESNASIESGRIYFKTENLMNFTEKEMRRIRGNKITMIFQNPMNTLNPSYSIYKQIEEIFKIHGSRRNYKKEVIKILERVKIPTPSQFMHKYPFELSGGMKQRIIIAMACAQTPDIIIADEPTSALDVSTQAEILTLLKEMVKEIGCGLLLITHDMGVVAEMANRVIVMYCGRKLEERNAEEFFKEPLHPYTQGLLNACPANFNKRFQTIPGDISEDCRNITGCVFARRCTAKTEYCEIYPPQEIPLSTGGSVSCWLRKQGQNEI